MRDALGVQTIHHSLHQVNLVLDAKVDKVRVDENVVRWFERGVVLAEERGGLGLDALEFGFVSKLALV